MRYQHILIIIFLALLAACAPKTTKETTSSTPGPKGSGDFRAAAPVAGPARPIQIGTFEEFSLANGLKVIVVENHKLPQISYSLTIDRDPNMERDKSGLADMAGSLMATGTRRKSKAEIDEAVDYIGASLSTNANGGFASSLTKHTDKILSLFAEVLFQPSFPEAEFEKIKTQTLSGLQTQKDDPNAISGNVSNVLTYGKEHPYGEITNEITVSNITLEDCKSYYRDHFKPGSAYLVVVGDITPAEARTRVEKYFGDWSGGKAPSATYVTPKPIDKAEVDFVDKAGAVQSVINIVHPVNLVPGHPDVIPARVMNTILGSGFSGRLFRNLREDKAYTYGAYSSLDADELVGEFSASASVRNEVTDSAVTQFLLELNRMRNEPVTESELELAKNFIAGGFARSLENPRTVASFALNMNMYNLPKDYYETYLQKLAKVTVQDVQGMAKKYVDPARSRIVVVGNKDAVMDKLARFDKQDGKVQEYDVYGNPKKSVAGAASDIDAATLIERYFTALGGLEKIKSVTAMDQTYSMELMGMQVTNRIVQDAGKYYMSMSAPGMDLVKQIYDGNAGVIMQMGQRMTAEGDDLEGLKKQGILFPEMNYLGAGYMADVKGTEEIDGRNCYKLVITDPAGETSTEFYDATTYLKVKQIEVQSAQGQTVTTTITYGDYKTVDGITLPHVLTISGPMPTPMVMRASSIKINPTVDPALFKM